ncbi:hypothetical protein CFP65_0593 [Kitasatospora sp. MMS16-BH015]|nr:hypothetical protein CFP65_0593 [Kitasatospora sp. MMS16-BH015]
MLRFGVNYTPTEGWFHHWLDFDLDSIRRDLDSLSPSASTTSGSSPSGRSSNPTAP